MKNQKRIEKKLAKELGYTPSNQELIIFHKGVIIGIREAQTVYRKLEKKDVKS